METTQSDLPQGVLDVYVAVHRDGAQVQYARRRAHNVEGDPRIAEFSSEYPIAEQIVNAGECHHQ